MDSTTLNKHFTCTRCGKCCLANPCMYAQTKYHISARDKCPDLMCDGDIYNCRMIEQDKGVKDNLITGYCDNPNIPNLEDFEIVLKESLFNKGLVSQFNRLRNCQLGVDKRKPIERMIDESTGYQKVLDDKQMEHMRQFAIFVWNCIYLPFLNIMTNEPIKQKANAFKEDNND